MKHLGQLVTSLPMSLITLYNSPIQCNGLISFAFSQSGISPDLVIPTRYFQQYGAKTVAFVNAEQSDLGNAAKW